MAEIKNTFLKSKMNKDLDDRILPNGEYRDANNISVGRSEDSDVGALENIIGNALVTPTQLNIPELEIIGTYSNDVNNKILVFLTTYKDPNTNQPTFSPDDETHYICSYDSSTQSYVILVSGTFLNFSKTNRITGINLIEDLLFWTDNRNQPRKININLAISAGNPTRTSIPSPQPAYYTQEHQISVAKYNPYQAIRLYNKTEVIATGGTSLYFTLSGDRVTELTPFIGASVTSQTIPFMRGNDYIFVAGVFLIGGNTRITLTLPASGNILTGSTILLIQSTMTNKDTDSAWPGDPNYLEDKFVRFSYRFQFDDNEYSIMAPFTQIAYIPTQKGYFVAGDENAAYQSTIVDFMTNNVQNIGLVVPLPDVGNRISLSYKIRSIELLFRESDSVAVKVLESIPVSEVAIASINSAEYTYDYQSRKPYKTLPEIQTTRVYDKVPVKSFAQESAGNRIIYGNFTDKYTPPRAIDYNCSIADKSGGGVFSNYIEYPNHSVKKNRNYQAGFVLSDKLGRKSPVILSSVNSGALIGGDFFGGSTIYSSYDSSAGDIASWFGNAIQLAINSPINSEINNTLGTPGLYAIAQQNATDGPGFAVVDDPTNIISGSGNPNNIGTWTFKLDLLFSNNRNIPIVGDFLRGKYVDFVEVTEVVGPSGGQVVTVTTDGTVNDLYAVVPNLPAETGDIKFAYRLNDKGWYSYTVVVKQTQQEYYNAYLPGILNGYPGQFDLGEGTTARGAFPVETNLTAHTVLLNDNINKIPRDLSEVGPTQAQFRSSVTLYGIVTNTLTLNTNTNEYEPQNKQYFPRTARTQNPVGHTVNTIATSRDLDMAYSQLSDNTIGDLGAGGVNGDKVFYQIDTNPLIARISTLEKSIGVTNLDPAPSTDPATNTNDNMLPFLAVYETKPVESLLDIYWEATSEGMISDLNADVLTGYEGAVGLTDIDWDFPESKNEGEAVTGWINAVNMEGGNIIGASFAMSVTNSADPAENVNDVFALQLGPGNGGADGQFRIVLLQSLVWEENSYLIDYFYFNIEVTTPTTTEDIINNLPFEGGLTNIVPNLDPILDYIITNQDHIVLSAATVLSKNPVNGASSDADILYQLRYSFTGGPINTITGEPDWTIIPETGEMQQDINATPPVQDGIYDIAYTISDALGVGIHEPGDNFLSYTQHFTVNMSYDVVNPDLLTDPCIVNIYAEDGTLLQPTDGEVRARKMITTSLVEGEWEKSGCWYISDRTFISDDDLPAVWGSFPHEDKFATDLLPNDAGAYRIGSGTHKSGTINFHVNSSQQVFDNNEELQFGAFDVRIYRRYLGDSQDDWQQVFANSELNRQDPDEFEFGPIFYETDIGNQGGGDTGRVFEILINEPYPYNNTGNPTEGLLQFSRANLPGSNYPGGTSVDFDRTDGNTPSYHKQYVTTQGNQQKNGWWQAIRAYDFNDQQIEGEASRELEWCIIARNLEYKFTEFPKEEHKVGNRPYLWVQVDDLHYPTCVIFPDELGTGINIMDHSPYAPVDGARQRWFVYDSSNWNSIADQMNYNPIMQVRDGFGPTGQYLYAETPYPEYVQKFYTNKEMSSPHIPAADGNQYMNFALTTSNGGIFSEFSIPNTQWRWKNDAGKNLMPKWFAKFKAAGEAGAGDKVRSINGFGLSAIPAVTYYANVGGSFAVGGLPPAVTESNTANLGGSFNSEINSTPSIPMPMMEPTELFPNSAEGIWGPPLAAEQQASLHIGSGTTLEGQPIQDGVVLNNQGFGRIYNNPPT